jgi:ribonuclease P protein component
MRPAGATIEMTDLRYPPSARLRRQADFDRVHRSPAYAADNVLVVKGCRNSVKTTRLGMSVSRRVGGAVVRNRWKRRIREAFRLTRQRLPAGLDLVVRPRKGATPDAAAIRDSLPRLVKRVASRLERNRA